MFIPVALIFIFVVFIVVVSMVLFLISLLDESRLNGLKEDGLASRCTYRFG